MAQNLDPGRTTSDFDPITGQPLQQNPDPITGAPGAHPVGTGVGAAGGAITGAAVGAVGGPVGSAVGLVAGAVVGGLAGKGVAEQINPTAEDAYWRDKYTTESYYETGLGYDDYRPAYELGWAGRGSYEGDFTSYEDELSRNWESRRGSSSLTWPQARPATRAAWDRIEATRSNADVADNADVVQVLNDLLENARDGEYGFRTSAERATDPGLKSVLAKRAEDCRTAGVELQSQIVRVGGSPDEGGSISGALHRGWVKVRDALTPDSDQAILDECERGEDTALGRYRKALKSNLPADIRALVQRQADGAQRNHDQIKALRDQHRARG